MIFADSDLEKAAATAPYAVFDNAGQDCCARSRILVERSAYDRFMALFEAAVAGVVVTDPGDEKAEMGPLISAAAARDGGLVRHRRVDRRVPRQRPDRRRASGTRRPSSPRPTRPTGSCTRRSSARSSRSSPFDDEADAIRIANDSEFGLSGSIWTRDVGKAIRVSRGIESGNLSVNSHSSVRYWTPFGGFKSSGLGRELGPDAPFAFTETKNVFISTT